MVGYKSTEDWEGPSGNCSVIFMQIQSSQKCSLTAVTRTLPRQEVCTQCTKFAWLSWSICVKAGGTSPTLIFIKVKKTFSKSLNKTLSKNGSRSFLEITCKVWSKVIAWSYSKLCIVLRVAFSLCWIIFKNLFIKWLHRFDHLYKCIQSCLVWTSSVCNPTMRTLYEHLIMEIIYEYHIMEKEQKSEVRAWASFRGSHLENSNSPKDSSVPGQSCTMHQVSEERSQIYTEGGLQLLGKRKTKQKQETTRNLKIQENTQCW